MARISLAILEKVPAVMIPTTSTTDHSMASNVIACRIQKGFLDKLRRLFEGQPLPCIFETFKDSSELFKINRTRKLDAILYEIRDVSSSQTAIGQLIQELSAFSVPVIVIVPVTKTKKVCEFIKTQYDGTDFYVLPKQEHEVRAALTAILISFHTRLKLQSVNDRLAEIVEEHARAMQRQEEQCRFIIESCSEMVLILDISENFEVGHVIEANHKALQWLGKSINLKQKINFFQLLLFDNLEEKDQVLKSIMSGKKTSFRAKIRTGKAEIHEIEAIGKVFQTTDLCKRLCLVARHLLHDEQSEKREQQTDYSYWATQAGFLMYEGDLRTQEMIWGGAVEEVTGISAKELSAGGLKGWRKRISPEDYRRVISTVNGAIKNLGKYQLEYRIIHAAGSIKHIEDQGVVLPDSSGNPCKLLGTMKDISNRVQAHMQRSRIEDELQHSQRLESLGLLAGGIAHDFNNILAGIIGLTDLALREVPEDSFVHEDLTEVFKAANRAKELVKQILAFSRQTEQERSPLYLHIIAREVIKLLRASLPPYIEIIDNADTHSGVIMANAAQMYQVITNLSMNAAQAMLDKSGKIEIRVQDIDLTENQAKEHAGLRPGPYVLLSVLDTGHGMSESVLARVFDPFFTTKGPGEGTGMGLAVVHGIVTDHGGVVTAQSTLGKGSRFDVYFPRISGVKIEDSQVYEKSRGGNERILFVDDDAAVLRFAESALPRLGFQLTVCASSEEALNTLVMRPDQFDLVITDQIMPGMSGVEFAETVHANLPKLPIILFTGFSDEAIPKEKLESVGIKEVVFKPIIIRDLVEAIRRAVDTSLPAL